MTAGPGRPQGLGPRSLDRLAALARGGARCGVHLALITESELYAGAPRRNRREAARKASFDNWLKDLTELKVGDPVVHESHGIGRYRGLVRIAPTCTPDASAARSSCGARWAIPRPTCRSARSRPGR